MITAETKGEATLVHNIVVCTIFSCIFIYLQNVPAANVGSGIQQAVGVPFTQVHLGRKKAALRGM